MLGEAISENDGELIVSFGYQCNVKKGSPYEISDVYEIQSGTKLRRKSSSFSCLSGAAISANATLANTNICNGLIGEGMLPSLDSPTSFRRIPSSPSLSWLDILSSSEISTPSCCLSTQSGSSGWDTCNLKSMSAPSRSEGYLSAMDVDIAGGAAGEDRVQAVCSEENGWLFCAIYDGFNGRDAADFLAGTLYETIVSNLSILDDELKEKMTTTTSDDSCTDGVLISLQSALGQAESDFLHMVEQEMEDRPDLVSIGSCVLVILIHGKNLYTLNLGDSRAVLAMSGEAIDMDGSEILKTVQLTASHSVDNEVERKQLLRDHPDDPATIVSGRVKGKLKLTRAFGVGYLKKQKLNDALMGILKVRNLLSPPYVSTQPSLNVHRISKDDCFVIVGSDGLFDFFSNDEAVKLVHSYILSNPSGDPAKLLLKQLVLRAANSAGFSTEELMRVPAGRRRKYHDDVTVIVIILGSNQRTSKASTFL
ncbi:hypothetical protein GIB67_015136 [Kingdonia uniflora]|uniref:PPM-type phosphatase domain-containing protein n=1 Tax=Kingdonia uniflora TaxID=39325 RepID=A0A7J7LJF2_9MAGN|nr:hypothetical protein GIB67_015136 [Kingdonia uniflora]